MVRIAPVLGAVRFWITVPRLGVSRPHLAEALDRTDYVNAATIHEPTLAKGATGSLLAWQLAYDTAALESAQNWAFWMGWLTLSVQRAGGYKVGDIGDIGDIGECLVLGDTAGLGRDG
jgi:hypothetical protein